MIETKQPEISLDRVIHEQARLAIITYLAGSPQREVTFTELKQQLELSAGNLSAQLRNLEAADYVQISKVIEGRKPVTRVSLTRQGFEALSRYIGRMEEIIGALKRSTLCKPKMLNEPEKPRQEG